MPGQPQLGTNEYFGIDACDLVVCDFEGTPSNYVIEKGDAFKVSITLKFDGAWARFLLGCCLGWKVCYCFEWVCCGHKDEKHSDAPICSKVYTAEDSYPYAKGVFTYGKERTAVIVPAGTLPPGTYRVTAIVKFFCKCDHKVPPPGFAAFTDGPMIEILG